MDKGKEQWNESTDSSERKIQERRVNERRVKERVDKIVIEVSEEMKNRKGLRVRSSSHSCDGPEEKTATSARNILMTMIEEKKKKIQKLAREVEYLRGKEKLEPS